MDINIKGKFIQAAWLIGSYGKIFAYLTVALIAQGVYDITFTLKILTLFLLMLLGAIAHYEFDKQEIAELSLAGEFEQIDEYRTLPGGQILIWLSPALLAVSLFMPGALPLIGLVVFLVLIFLHVMSFGFSPAPALGSYRAYKFNDKCYLISNIDPDILNCMRTNVGVIKLSENTYLANKKYNLFDFILKGESSYFEVFKDLALDIEHNDLASALDNINEINIDCYNNLNKFWLYDDKKLPPGEKTTELHNFLVDTVENEVPYDNFITELKQLTVNLIDNITNNNDRTNLTNSDEVTNSTNVKSDNDENSEK